MRKRRTESARKYLCGGQPYSGSISGRRVRVKNTLYQRAGCTVDACEREIYLYRRRDGLCAVRRVSFSVGLEVTPVEEREEWFYGDDYAFSLEAAEGYTLSEDYKVFVGDREASKGDDGYWHVTLEKENEISADLLSVAKYTVSFNSAGGSEVASRQVEYGRKVSRPEDPMREGYLFVGWKFGEEDFDFDWIVTEDIVLTAVWKKAEVVSDENGNSGCGSEAAGTFAFAVILAAGYVAKKCRRRR